MVVVAAAAAAASIIATYQLCLDLRLELIAYSPFKV